MSYPFNYPTPQNANIQIFREGGSSSDWVKPQGASFVWFTLIGGGGGGFKTGTFNSQSGGGSAAVTNFMGPAFLMPDVLRVNVGAGGINSTSTATAGGASTVIYQQKNTTGYTLLTANGGGAGISGSGGAGGAASTSNYFTAMGFFNSVAGQAGQNGSAITPSATTFLSGGTGQGYQVQANYGYSTAPSGYSDGFFMMQPIMVGVGSVQNGNAGTGCGAGGGATGAGGKGGDGLVVIITW